MHLEGQWGCERAVYIIVKGAIRKGVLIGFCRVSGFFSCLTGLTGTSSVHPLVGMPEEQCRKPVTAFLLNERSE